MGSVTFPRSAGGAAWPGEATLDLRASESGLDCRLTASAPGPVEVLKGAVAGHLDWFAFREAPLPFDWQDA